jgi:predicted DNA-binding antitoxin AbrB/MazE fold protein
MIHDSEANSMTKTLDAIYERGVLRLQEPLDLRERTQVKVTIRTPDETAFRHSRGPRKVPPGAGAFDSGHTDTAERAEVLLEELAFGEDRGS